MSELEPKMQKKHTVEYSIEYTKNLGNFENVKVRVGLSQEGFGHPDGTMDKVGAWVEDTLGERLAEVTAALEESSE